MLSGFWRPRNALHLQRLCSNMQHGLEVFLCHPFPEESEKLHHRYLQPPQLHSQITSRIPSTDEFSLSVWRELRSRPLTRSGAGGGSFGIGRIAKHSVIYYIRCLNQYRQNSTQSETSSEGILRERNRPSLQPGGREARAASVVGDMRLKRIHILQQITTDPNLPCIGVG